MSEKRIVRFSVLITTPVAFSGHHGRRAGFVPSPAGSESHEQCWQFSTAMRFADDYGCNRSGTPLVGSQGRSLQSGFVAIPPPFRPQTPVLRPWRVGN